MRNTPAARVQDLAGLNGTHLVMITLRERDSWRQAAEEAAEPPPSSETGVRRLTVAEVIDRYEVHMDVLGIAPAELLISQRLDGMYVLGFLNGEKLLTYREDETSGTGIIDVWHVGFNPPLIGGQNDQDTP